MGERIFELTNKILQFRDKRDWKQFHTPKNLAISLSIEAGELLECFQWKNDDEVDSFINGPDREKLEDEIADVATYLLLLCNETGIDLEQAIESKIKKNDAKYPVEKSKGNAKKYNEL